MPRVFGALALAICIAGVCSARAEDGHTGTERWTGTPAPLCDKPDDPSLPRQCVLYSGPLKVISATTDAFGGTTFLVHTTDGRDGYISADYPLLSDVEHAAFLAKMKKGPCAQRGVPSLGMIGPQIYATCWGRPSQVNTTVAAGGKLEQWVYPGRGYLYLKDDILTTIQTTR